MPAVYDYLVGRLHDIPEDIKARQVPVAGSLKSHEEFLGFCTYGRAGRGKTFTDAEAMLQWYALQLESHEARGRCRMRKLRKIAVTIAGAGRWLLEDLLGGPGIRHGR